MPLAHNKHRRTLIAVTLVCITAIAAFLIAWLRTDPLYSSSRQQWKTQAIAQIQQRLADKNWLAAETARLQHAASQPSDGDWVGDNLLIAKNGDWIVCENICNKENRRIKDLFIGRASDGNWYYSTFHFCVNKTVLTAEPQPESLDQFVDAYWLTPFDGRSDDCLKATWIGQPWGDTKLKTAHP